MEGGEDGEGRRSEAVRGIIEKNGEEEEGAADPNEDLLIPMLKLLLLLLLLLGGGRRKGIGDFCCFFPFVEGVEEFLNRRRAWRRKDRRRSMRSLTIDTITKQQPNKIQTIISNITIIILHKIQKKLSHTPPFPSLPLFQHPPQPLRKSYQVTQQPNKSPPRKFIHISSPSHQQPHNPFLFLFLFLSLPPLL